MSRIWIKYFPFFLFVYHLLFAWISYDYVNQNNGDAVRYWFIGQNLKEANWFQFLHPGTDAVYFLTFPFVKFLNLSPLMGCFLFSFWSGLGFLSLWKLAASEFSKNNLYLLLAACILLLPNAHFWTSLIGKEAILFLPIVVLAKEIYKGKNYSIGMILSFLSIAWIRPHLAFLFLFAWLVGVFLKGKMSTTTKTIYLGISILFTAGLYFVLQKITNARHGLWTKISNLYEAHNLKLKNTSAYVPMEEYVYPYKIMSFFFRPFPWEKSGAFYLFLGIEGLLALGISCILLFLIWKNFRIMKWNSFSIFALIFLISFGSVFAFAYANFGMIVRTRSLAFPIGFLFLVWAFSQFRTRNKNSESDLE